MRICFSNDILFVEADTLGAELVSIVFEGKEKLWQNESGEWAGHAPVLFPICGNCTVRVGGNEYPLERHGFARKREFTLIEQRRDAVRFELRSDEGILEQFPYPFVFRVRYFLRGARLRIGYEITNPSDGELYFSCGGHESFVLEHSIGEYELQFSKREKFVSLLHDDAGRLTGERIVFGEGNRLPLPAEYLSDSRTIILSGVRSRKVRLCERGGRSLAEISFRGFSNLLLWHPGASRMICIEPWHNLPDGNTTSEFPKREGIVCVPSHQKKKFEREIIYL